MPESPVLQESPKFQASGMLSVAAVRGGITIIPLCCRRHRIEPRFIVIDKVFAFRKEMFQQA
jgi:hypothetical protein